MVKWLSSMGKWLVVLQSARTAASGTAASGTGARRVGTFGAALVGGVLGLTAASAVMSRVRSRESV